MTYCKAPGIVLYFDYHTNDSRALCVHAINPQMYLRAKHPLSGGNGYSCGNDGSTDKGCFAMKKRLDEYISLYWSYVKKGRGCWEWTGPKNQGGYGRIWWYGHIKIVATHVAWYLSHGYYPKPMKVLHTCDNPGCVNPNHLFLGTQTDNMRDMVSKKRYANNAGENNPAAKLSGEKAREIRVLFEHGCTREEIMNRYGVCRSTVNRVISGNRWK